MFEPGVAERAMYFGTTPGSSRRDTNRRASPRRASWFLAEGATGPFFDTFLLLANPNLTQAAATTFTFLTDAGRHGDARENSPCQRPACTVNIEVEASPPALANAAVATTVTSLLPIIVERAQYWPFSTPRSGSKPTTASV